MAVPSVRIAEELGWPEGPAELTDGTIAFVEAYRSCVSVVDPTARLREPVRPRVVAVVDGAPNAVAAGSDGALYVTQNGGVVGPWRATVRCPASIQRVVPGGTVETLVTEVDGVKLQAPNDLCFGLDGRLYFTDPGRHDLDLRPDPGYVFALSPSGKGEVIAEMPPCYPNGIVAESTGAIVWVESYTRLVKRLSPDGSIAVVCELADGRVPDGLAIAANGDFYIATTGTGDVDVIASDGTPKETIHVGPCPTNCAFVGSQLLVTDGGHRGDTSEPKFVGCLWALDVGVCGHPLYQGAIA